MELTPNDDFANSSEDVKLKVGGADEFISGGDEIFETESAIELEELVSKYIFEKE